jgi:Succinyl-CoA synthetase, beta subunit
MKLHEHQAKTIFADAGIPVPDSRLATTVDEALDAVDEIGYPAAIKAQVHVGGRGKAGGIKIATDRDEAEQYAEEILGMDLKGYTVDQILVEQGVDFVDELYVGVTMDRGEGQPVLMVSTEGGVNIEEVAEDEPRRDRARARRPRVRAPPVSGPQGRLRGRRRRRRGAGRGLDPHDAVRPLRGERRLGD